MRGGGDLEVVMPTRPVVMRNSPNRRPSPNTRVASSSLVADNNNNRANANKSNANRNTSSPGPRRGSLTSPSPSTPRTPTSSRRRESMPVKSNAKSKESPKRPRTSKRPNAAMRVGRTPLITTEWERRDEELQAKFEEVWRVKSVEQGMVRVPLRMLEELIHTETIEKFFTVDQKPVASGLFATVRKCRHRETGIEYAAKYSSRIRCGVDCSMEILHEIAMLALCNDSNKIVHLKDVFQNQHEIILVLEYAPGGDFQSVLDADMVPFEQDARTFIRQILEALAYIHERNVAHLDIKPQNIVLMGQFPNCEIKLCDLEVARVIRPDESIREIIGTPDYVAPEILCLDPINLSADIWSLGVLTYVLLTGFSPFGGDTDQETLRNIALVKLDFPDELFEGVSKEAKNFIQQCLQRKPESRPTVSECLSHAWLLEEEEPPSPSPLMLKIPAMDEIPITKPKSTPQLQPSTLSRPTSLVHHHGHHVAHRSSHVNTVSNGHNNVNSNVNNNVNNSKDASRRSCTACISKQVSERKRYLSKSREALSVKVANSQLKKSLSKSRERLCDLSMLTKSGNRSPSLLSPTGEANLASFKNLSRSQEVISSVLGNRAMKRMTTHVSDLAQQLVTDNMSNEDGNKEMSLADLASLRLVKLGLIEGVLKEEGGELEGRSSVERKAVVLIPEPLIEVNEEDEEEVCNRRNNQLNAEFQEEKKEKNSESKSEDVPKTDEVNSEQNEAVQEREAKEAEIKREEEPKESQENIAEEDRSESKKALEETNQQLRNKDEHKAESEVQPKLDKLETQTVETEKTRKEETQKTERSETTKGEQQKTQKMEKLETPKATSSQSVGIQVELINPSNVVTKKAKCCSVSTQTSEPNREIVSVPSSWQSELSKMCKEKRVSELVDTFNLNKTSKPDKKSDNENEMKEKRDNERRQRGRRGHRRSMDDASVMLRLKNKSTEHEKIVRRRSTSALLAEKNDNELNILKLTGLLVEKKEDKNNVVKEDNKSNNDVKESNVFEKENSNEKEGKKETEKATKEGKTCNSIAEEPTKEEDKEAKKLEKLSSKSSLTSSSSSPLLNKFASSGVKKTSNGRKWDFFEIDHPKAISEKKLEQLKAKYQRRKTSNHNGNEIVSTNAKTVEKETKKSKKLFSSALGQKETRCDASSPK